MNKRQALATIMMLLCEDAPVKPGTTAYRVLRRMISDKIDRLGPEAALFQVGDRRARITDQIRRMARWRDPVRKDPANDG